MSCATEVTPILPYDIEPQSGLLSTLYGGWIECPSCRQVTRGGAACPRICSDCGAQTEIPAMYFRVPVLALLDLIQLQRWAQPSVALSTTMDPREVAIVLFSCALQEALLEQLLRARMLVMGFPAEARKLAFDRSQAFRGRMNLFKDLVGESLDKVAKRIDSERFQAVREVLEKAGSLRNQFLHRGQEWEEPIARECVNIIPDLLHLFVDLHNEIVAKAGSISEGSH